MTTRRHAMLTLGAALGGLGVGATAGTTKRVRITRLPEGDLQPQVAQDISGKLHRVTYRGEPQHGNLFYAVSSDAGGTFSRAIRVNTEPGSAIATGTIRGAQIAVGRKGLVHVAWDGSTQTGPVNADSGKRGMPMLYTRMTTSRDAF
ncbi:MAG: hypothetical protein IT170_07585, partial [Bryobacterales bacterium]|nr:hypothetical protein [Bryobacterales bacterium]